MAVTARDVAEAVGVSISTVSRALSAPDRVAPATRDRVLCAVERLGYRPNPAARGLITGRTGNIGLIVPDLENPFFSSIAKGAQLAARSRELTMFVADSGEDPAIEASLAERLLPQVDGLILASSRMDSGSVAALAAATSVVTVNRRIEGVASATIDDAGAASDGVRYLAALGHRRVAYAAGPEGSYSDAGRRAGVEAAAESGDLDVVWLGPFRPVLSAGRAVADLSLGAGATGIIAYNDLIALGAIARFAELGVDVPGRVSIIGFDDVPLAALSAPGLTTMALPKTGLGGEAVALLAAAVDGGPPEDTVLAGELLVRGSTALARNGR